MFKVGFLADVYELKPANRVITRFPPEPNGFLHLEHSKAIAINFGSAQYRGGVCYLRYDDTNPAKEEEKYFTAIADNIQWLGYEPDKVTYSSDYFDYHYELAEELIQKSGAYVCHCSKSDVSRQRGGGKGVTPRYACPHRNRPISESPMEFRSMSDGKYAPGRLCCGLSRTLSRGTPDVGYDSVPCHPASKIR
ncbi:hypothetical protein BJX70DRAFT_179688 [Aspergillus crustosus]